MRCPNCDRKLIEVPRHSRTLNDDQYNSIKAGDWWCETCPDNNRGTAGFCYWWDHEIEAHNKRQCDAITYT